MPLLVMLHGSGDDARAAAAGLAPQADARGFLVLAPSSRKSTWDLRHAPACEDATFIDGALARVFASARVDAARVALMGISDGASFALSLGLANGDLFRDLLIFSAGYFHPGPVIGHPRSSSAMDGATACCRSASASASPPRSPTRDTTSPSGRSTAVTRSRTTG